MERADRRGRRPVRHLRTLAVDALGRRRTVALAGGRRRVSWDGNAPGLVGHRGIVGPRLRRLGRRSATLPACVHRYAIHRVGRAGGDLAVLGLRRASQLAVRLNGGGHRLR